jgi:hypothetical protein
MPFLAKILLACMLLGPVLVSGCGSTRGSYPSPSQALSQIPVRAALRDPCETVSTPDEGALPAIAEDPAARLAQLNERAFWMSFDLQHNVIEARQCLLRLELIGVVDAFNSGQHALAEGRGDDP